MSASLITLIPLFFGFLWPAIKVERRIEVVPIVEEKIQLEPMKKKDFKKILEEERKAYQKELEELINQVEHDKKLKLKFEEKVNNPDNWKQKK